MNHRINGVLTYAGIDIVRSKGGRIYKSTVKFKDKSGHKLYWQTKDNFYNEYIVTGEIEEGFLVMMSYTDVITKGDITYINRVKIDEY